ncbi:unnamed protein product, partial [Ectocarpus fasciculatus]
MLWRNYAFWGQLGIFSLTGSVPSTHKGRVLLLPLRNKLSPGVRFVEYVLWTRPQNQRRALVLRREVKNRHAMCFFRMVERRADLDGKGFDFRFDAVRNILSWEG